MNYTDLQKWKNDAIQRGLSIHNSIFEGNLKMGLKPQGGYYAHDPEKPWDVYGYFDVYDEKGEHSLFTSADEYYDWTHRKNY